jgi:hypothetical protein
MVSPVMSPSRALIVGLWPVTLIAAFWLGRTRSVDPTSPAAPASTSPATSLTASAGAPAPTSRVAQAVERTRTPSPAPAVAAGAAEADPFAAGLGGISTRGTFHVLSNNDPLERTAAFVELLRRLDRGNAYEVLDAFERGEFGFDRSREYSLFLYAWGQVDGPAAARHLQEQGGRGWDRLRDMQGVLSGWATRDPDGAIGWAKENWNGEENPYLVGVISGVAKADLARASTLAESLPYGRVRGQAADLLVDGHLQKGSAEAMAWAESITDERLREGVMRRVALKLGQKEPALAADWVVRATPEEKRGEALGAVLETWGRAEPVQAADWLANQADPALRAQGTTQLAGLWARRDPVAAGEWLGRQKPGPELDPALESYARAIRRSDPARALQWAGAITDTEKRRANLERLMAEWTERDPEAAAAFLHRGPSAP